MAIPFESRRSLAVYTGSEAPRVSKCIASGLFGSLPQSGDGARVGNAGHLHMAHRSALGVDEAMQRLPETCARFGLTEPETGILTARLRKFDYVPPPFSVAEVALCITTGPRGARAVRVTGGKGHYPDLPANALCPTQIDLIYSEPAPLDFTDPKRPRCPAGSTLFVIDYKFGDDAYVDPVERNAQLAHAAVAAAEWTGAETVVPCIVYPGPGDGEWDVPTDAEGNAVAWDVDRLELEYGKVVDLHAERVREMKRLQKGEPPRVNEGTWCGWCRSADSCPSKLALVRAVVDPSAPMLATGPLTDEQAAKLVHAHQQAQRFEKRARAALETYARTQGKPIDLGDGRVWGPIVVELDEIDPKIAEPVMVSELGAFRYQAVRVSKQGLEEAMAAKHLDEGKVRQRAGAMRVLFAKLIESGGMKKVAREEYRVYQPAPTLPAAPADEPTPLQAALVASVEKVEAAQPKPAEDTYGLDKD